MIKILYLLTFLEGAGSRWPLDGWAGGGLLHVAGLLTKLYKPLGHLGGCASDSSSGEPYMTDTLSFCFLVSLRLLTCYVPLRRT